MTTVLVTPAPVYWLLDLIQTVGIIGILAGIWYLPYAMQRRDRPVRIVLVQSPLGRVSTTGRRRRNASDRGAGRIETILAWAVFLGAAAGAWALIVFFLAGRVGA